LEKEPWKLKEAEKVQVSLVKRMDNVVETLQYLRDMEMNSRYFHESNPDKVPPACMLHDEIRVGHHI
jgi:hypothetical protein